MKNEIMFKEYISLLCETFDKSLSSALSTLYWRVLEPFTDEQCEAAFKEINKLRLNLKQGGPANWEGAGDVEETCQIYGMARGNMRESGG